MAVVQLVERSVADSKFVGSHLALGKKLGLNIFCKKFCGKERYSKTSTCEVFTKHPA